MVLFLPVSFIWLILYICHYACTTLHWLLCIGNWEVSNIPPPLHCNYFHYSKHILKSLAGMIKLTVFPHIDAAVLSHEACVVCIYGIMLATPMGWINISICITCPALTLITASALKCISYISLSFPEFPYFMLSRWILLFSFPIRCSFVANMHIL